MAPHDVIVVGGGVAGCAVAYELAKRSVRVLLIDQHLPGRATSASAGGLWPVGEAVGLGCGVIYHASQSNAQPAGLAPTPLPDVFRDFLVHSNQLFPAIADELAGLTGASIEYSVGRGLVFIMYTPEDQAVVDNVARSLPDAAVLEILGPEDIAKIEPALTRDLVGGALLPEEHQVNPMMLAEAYKQGALGHGAQLRHDSRVTGIRRRGDRVVGVEIGDEFIPAETTINAAGAWAGELAATADVLLPVFPVRGQVVLTETLPAKLSTCLSTSDCYLLQKHHGEVLIGSTTERVGFGVAITEDAVRSLCRGAIRAVPMLGEVNVKRIWAGLRPGTPDELPILGPVAGVRGLVNATGGFRTGIVATPLLAQVVAQCVVDEPLEFPIEPFLASRFELSAQVD